MKERVNVFIKDLGRNPTVVGIDKAVDEIQKVSADPNLKPFLQPSKNCQPDNLKIIALAKQIVGNKTSNYNKTRKIFEYVRINEDYGHYYRTKHGALGMLDSKTGNCYDILMK